MIPSVANASYQPIENYGVIGDLRTVALVGMTGSIDFMCFPDFDSPTIFASLLDTHKGGSFQITPLQENGKYKQMYLPDTNILLTRFLFSDGIAELTDFMPVANLYKENILVRRVKSIKGKMTFRMLCSPRFNYARSGHTTKRDEKAIIFTSKGKDKLVLLLKSSVPIQIREGDGFAEFSLKPGETAEFILENITKEASCKESCKEFVDQAFTQTLNYWRNWAAQSTYKGRWREMVTRSSLVLKLLISHKYGSIIAAPTFGLPELLGGEKNWDYRYTWIRDAAFTVYALMRLGYTQETDAFIRWIEDKLQYNLKKKHPLGLLYGIDGKIKIEEKEFRHLEGYRHSFPVRLGNAAYQQRQLDIYGDLMDSVYLYDKFVSPVSYDTWQALTVQIDWIAKNWKSSDHGIWEIRGEKREFLHSRFMCWVALDRAIRLATKRSFPMSTKWIVERDKIMHSVFHDFWNEKLQTFVQFKGSNKVDASCLLMPLVRFISPQDPRWLSTLKRVEEQLMVDSLVYRYMPEQAKEYGLKQGEGTFSLCSFWYTECLSRAGQLSKARYYFEKMLGYANHLGLYSEQLGFQGEHLGNFPQALTHLALISTAYDLDRRLDERKPTS
ncbi:MAG: glycoside hydrolase family 15 protein [Parachlamydia sp.]|nr:glycoside hydrolase family 15 protein [Parachlamydia sp.]